MSGQTNFAAGMQARRQAQPVPARYQAGRQAIGLYATRVTVVSVGAYKMLPLYPRCHGRARAPLPRPRSAAAEPGSGLGA